MSIGSLKYACLQIVFHHFIKFAAISEKWALDL